MTPSNVVFVITALQEKKHVIRNVLSVNIKDHFSCEKFQLYPSACQFAPVTIAVKPRLNEQTFLSTIVLVAHNMGSLNEQTMFDQTSNKVSPHNAFCVLPLKLCGDVTQIRFLIGCLFPLALGFFTEVPKRSNIRS